jgi:hypothetical protein
VHEVVQDQPGLGHGDHGEGRKKPSVHCHRRQEFDGCESAKQRDDYRPFFIPLLCSSPFNDMYPCFTMLCRHRPTWPHEILVPVAFRPQRL